MKVSANFKFIGISMLFIVGLAACNKEETVMGSNSNTNNSTAVENPEGFLNHLVSTQAVVLGAEDGKTEPSIQISFSNGHMVSGAPGKDFAFSGPVLRGSTPYLTCVYFSMDFMGAGSSEELCLTVRDFKIQGIALKKGDLYIVNEFEANAKRGDPGQTVVYRAQVLPSRQNAGQ